MKPEELTEDHIETFQRDGAVCLRQMFERRWLEMVAEGIEQNLRAPGPNAEFLAAQGGTGRFFDDYCNWQAIEPFHRYVMQSPAAELAARLMRSERAIFYHEHVLIKEPGTTKRTPWHHDQPYYPVDGWQLCSIWMPVDPVPLETSLQFVRGSHAWGRFFMPRKFSTERNYPLGEAAAGTAADPALYEDVPDIDGDPERYKVLVWELEPGDCVVFHGRTLHGAASNRSMKRARRVISTRWLGDDARLGERPWEVSPPITGGLRPGDPMACDVFPVVWHAREG